MCHKSYLSSSSSLWSSFSSSVQKEALEAAGVVQKEALEAAGVKVGKTPSETATLMREVLASL
jgi:succinyl-CoA synthetase alpha subunit